MAGVFDELKTYPQTPVPLMTESRFVILVDNGGYHDRSMEELRLVECSAETADEAKEKMAGKEYE